MLASLHVENYVLIDSLDIEFPGGLVIVTGQTGAGKSIILGALSLVLGSKADASMVGEGGETCVVEAEFDAASDDVLRSVMEENDIDWCGGRLLIRRSVNRSGRSRSFVNDIPVQVQLLQTISARLVDIHSQHKTSALSEPAFQRSILDAFAGNDALLEECRELYRKSSALKKELSELRERARRSAAERDYNEAVFARLEAAGLRDGELEELETEQKQLANAEEIKETLVAVQNALSPSDEEMLSVHNALKEAEKLLRKAGRFIPAAESLASRIESSRLELDDILSEVESVNAGTEVSGERLQAVDERLSLLYGLMKKHACADMAELIAFRDSLSETLFDASSLEDRINEISKESETAASALAAIADRLHESRTGAAEAFSGAVLESLKFLELERSVFEVAFRDIPVEASGRDAVSFMFSASGRAPAELSKCASGGELSRIMLSLKAMMARFKDMPAMIFDEIDTGVSGSAADRMGSMICDMGKDMQVIAITHLPQVASKGDAHYLVSKSVSPVDGRTVTSIRRLSDEERVMEVARMLSGSVITDAAVENARTLLSAE